MTAGAGIDKVSLIHGLRHISQHHICRFMSVHLVDHAEFLDIKMNKCVILDPAISGYLKVRQKMILVIMLRNRLMKGHLI